MPQQDGKVLCELCGSKPMQIFNYDLMRPACFECQIEYLKKQNIQIRDELLKAKKRAEWDEDKR